MPRYASDIETDGLLNELTCIHCIVNVDIDTGETFRYAPHGTAGTHGLPVDGVRQLASASEIAFHNGIKFDIPAIEKVLGITLNKTAVRDTLVEARLIFSNIKQHDVRKRNKPHLPGKLFSSHSLKAWGFRLGMLKNQFGETADWQTFTSEMLDYCEQDARITRALALLLEQKQYAKHALDLEHKVAWLLAQQERSGFYFAEDKALHLYSVLSAERSRLEKAITARFHGWFAVNTSAATDTLKNKQGKAYRVKYPKRTVNAALGAKTLSTVKGAPYTPLKWVEFNPGSRRHIARLLMQQGWKPKEFTDCGDPKIDEGVLTALPPSLFPNGEATLLARLFMVQKRIAQLAEGKQAWLKLCRVSFRDLFQNGVFIHGSVNPNGAVTGRAIHSFPNVAQVPGSRAEYGRECRELFTVPAGWCLLGSDASGLELRCLGHFMARYDNGAYISIILEGDIHSANQAAAGLPTRDNAKTFMYAFLYGAGDAKIGEIVAPAKPASYQRKIGKALKAKFLRNTPALEQLRKAVEIAAKRGYLKGLDGRKIAVRSAHAALNTLLQSAGALICKYWIVEFERLALKAGLAHGWKGDFVLCAWVHDEIQVACRTQAIAERLAKISQQAMKNTQAFFAFRCPLDTDFNIGTSWAETH